MCRKRAASGVNMMVAGIPAELGRIDPALQPECERRGLIADVLLLSLLDIFRAARVFDGVIAGGKSD